MEDTAEVMDLNSVITEIQTTCAALAEAHGDIRKIFAKMVEDDRDMEPEEGMAIAFGLNVTQKAVAQMAGDLMKATGFLTQIVKKRLGAEGIDAEQIIRNLDEGKPPFDGIEGME